MERDDELEAMRAERAITKAMLRYTRGIDRCDEELLQSAYHDDAYDDHGDRFRGPAREFIPWTLGHLRKRFVSTMHTLHNIDIDVHGDWARAETYCISQHVVRADDGQLSLETFACRYLDRFEDRPGAGWRVAHRVVVREWAARQPMLQEDEQPPGFATGRRDRDDLSYAADLATARS